MVEMVQAVEPMFSSVRLARDSTRIAQPFPIIPQKAAMKLVREKNIVLLIISFDIFNIEFISENMYPPPAPIRQ